MEARFRIRTREGTELRPRTMEIFAELVRSGAIRPDDLVYDALTGLWVRAAQHPTVRLMKDPLANEWEPLDGGLPTPLGDADAKRVDGDGAVGVGANAAETAANRRVAEDSADRSGGVDDRGSDADGADGESSSDEEGSGENALDLTGALELVEPPSVSPEEEERAFIERMEDERRSDPDEPELFREVARAPVSTGTPATHGASLQQGYSALRRALLRPPRVRVTIARPGRPRGSWTRVALLGLAGIAALMVLAIVASVARSMYGAGDRTPELTAEAGASTRAPRRIPDTEGAVRHAAYGSFVSAVNRMRVDLGVGAVPAQWLSGRYLADPTAYPQVRQYWQRYLRYVEQAHTDETSLYRAAYLRTLDAAGVSGPVRSLRLARALGDFNASQAARTGSYAEAQELAAAALALDDTLVALRGRVRYEPAAGPRVSAAPVIEAAGTDAEAQARLNAALDRVLAALRANGPSLDVHAVPTWLISSLQHAAENAPTIPDSAVARR